MVDKGSERRVFDELMSQEGEGASANGTGFTRCARRARRSRPFGLQSLAQEIMNASPGALGKAARRHCMPAIAITPAFPGALLTGLGACGFTPLRSV